MDTSPEMQFENHKAAVSMVESVARGPYSAFANVIQSIVSPSRPGPAEELLAIRASGMERANLVSKAFRQNSRGLLGKQMPKWRELAKGNGATELSKAALDVGTLTNFASITGGQSLGYVSMDTQVARGTIRPSSFTLYQALNKTHANQVVDYWAYASDTGGPLPGAAFASYTGTGINSGTLPTSAGIYSLKNITLKLAVNGRALTVALAAQNSFVDISAQESTNAAIDILSTVNWAAYWGDSSVYANQFDGLSKTIPAANKVDFGAWSATYATQYGWSPSQTLFNLIYEVAGQITGFSSFGRITHAFMQPVTAASLNGLVTTLLNNVVQNGPGGIIVNGDLQGMRTRFGEIQFPIDLLIGARDRPAVSILRGDGTTNATTVSPTKPATVTVAVSGGADPGSKFTSGYVAASGWYQYAVASTDAGMTESTLTFATPTSGVTTTITNVVSIAGPAAADASVFRVYRTGLLGANTNLSGNPASFRYIGSVAAAGTGTVTFADQNAKIPGSDTIFLLDLDENDNALDFRYLLPLTRVDLYAAGLYMPWAVAAIGALRVRVPKFHGMILNVVNDDPSFNPLLPNASAT